MSRLVKEFFIIGTGIIAIIYLLNPGFGGLELIPDFVPIVGNLDEAAAVAILMNALSYYGFDLGNFYRRTPRKRVVRRIVSESGEVLKEEEVEA